MKKWNGLILGAVVLLAVGRASSGGADTVYRAGLGIATEPDAMQISDRVFAHLHHTLARTDEPPNLRMETVKNRFRTGGSGEWINAGKTPQFLVFARSIAERLETPGRTIGVRRFQSSRSVMVPGQRSVRLAG